MLKLPSFCILLLGVPLAFAITPADTFTGYVAEQGYNVTQHSVVTADGYILGLFRLPRPGAPVVLLQHGIFVSSWCWIDNHKEYAPAFQLYDRGYDVWMSNSRGNLFSRSHTSLAPDSDAFWNFTFEQMPLDVMGNTRYILNNTNKPSLSFVGWSQGTTQMFIAALQYSEELQHSINLFVAIAPVVYLTNNVSPLFQAIKRIGLVPGIFNRFYALYRRGVFDDSSWISKFEDLMCTLSLGELCKLTIDGLLGVSPYDDPAVVKDWAAHAPTATSAKDLVHFSQYSVTSSFARFDYGSAGNMQQYGTAFPPLFNLSAFPRIPVALFSGGNDDLVAATDLDKLVLELNSSTNRPVVFSRSYAQFSHVTWMVGTPAAFSWFDDFVSVLEMHAV